MNESSILKLIPLVLLFISIVMMVSLLLIQSSITAIFLDLMRSIRTSFDGPIKLTPIYIEIYSQGHLENYLQQRQLERQSKPAPLTNGTKKNEVISPVDKLDVSPESVPSSTTNDQQIG
jgi:hypothetical protein